MVQKDRSIVRAFIALHESLGLVPRTRAVTAYKKLSPDLQEYCTHVVHIHM